MDTLTILSAFSKEYSVYNSVKLIHGRENPFQVLARKKLADYTSKYLTR